MHLDTHPHGATDLQQDGFIAPADKVVPAYKTSVGAA
jgi:hypothetical protein